MGQILSSIVPFGVFAGKTFDTIYKAPEVNRKDDGHIMVIGPDGEEQLLTIAQPSDVIITSTLTNFSVDFISALQTVSEFDAKGIRVIAYQEDFDSSNLREQVLIQSLPLMHKFRKNAFKARRLNQLAGIDTAVKMGKFTGRKPKTPADFPDFGKYFNQYMMRELSKGEFAKKLKVSRPTLDKLIDDFTRKKGE